MKILKLTPVISAIFIVFLVALLTQPKSMPVTQTYSEQESPLPSPSTIPSPSPKLQSKSSSTPILGAATAQQSGFCLRVPLLLYHHIQPISIAQEKGETNLTVSPEYFDNHIAYLASSGYTTITVEQLALALLNHQSLPPKSIVITMDDGYQDIYTYAYPIIQKYHTIVNLMIPTGLMGNPGYLDWGQLKEMAGSGLAFPYNHTWSHASLGKASPEKIEFEIITAQHQLEEQLGKRVSIFAYPYGSENSLVVEFLKSHGFIAALSTIPGFTQCDSFIMSIHRNRVGNAPLTSYGL